MQLICTAKLYITRQPNPAFLNAQVPLFPPFPPSDPFICAGPTRTIFSKPQGLPRKVCRSGKIARSYRLFASASDGCFVPSRPDNRYEVLYPMNEEADHRHIP